MDRDTVDHFTEICEEVMGLVGVGGSAIRELTGQHGIDNGIELLDARFQEILNNLSSFTTGELICYIRYSYPRSPQLKNWLVLLDAAKKQAIERKEDNIDQMFRGLGKVYQSSF